MGPKKTADAQNAITAENAVPRKAEETVTCALRDAVLPHARTLRTELRPNKGATSARKPWAFPANLHPDTEEVLQLLRCLDGHIMKKGHQERAAARQ